MADEKPKIIVDDDWKAQAQEEKAKLSEETKAKAEPQEAPAPEGAPEGAGQQQLPEASFGTLANMLLTNAIMAMGGMEDPRTKKRVFDLPIAKFYIDNLEVLQEKTKGNLTDEEAKFIEKALYEMRMNFVHILETAKKGADKENVEPDNKPAEDK